MKKIPPLSAGTLLFLIITALTVLGLLIILPQMMT